MKAHKGLPGNEDADGVAKESVVQAGVNVNVNLSLLMHKLSGLNCNLISPNIHHYPGLVYHRGVFYTTRRVQSNLYYEFSIHLVHKLCAGAAPHHATRRYWEKRHVVWGPLGVGVVEKSKKAYSQHVAAK